MNLLLSGLAIILALSGTGLVISGTLKIFGILLLIEAGVLMTLTHKRQQ